MIHTSQQRDYWNSSENLARQQDTNKKNKHKSMGLVHIANVMAEEEFVQIFPFKTAGKKTLKFLEINVTKDLNDFYDENYKSLKKEIEDIKRSKNAPALELAELTLSVSSYYQR